MTDTTLCTICRRPAEPDPFIYLWNGRRFTIYRCTECTHQFVYPPVTPEDQAAIYSDRYFSKEGDWVCGLIGAGYVDAEAQLRAEAREILGMLPGDQQRSRELLDIGCAGGVFLDEARKAGYAVRGIELNATMAEHARSRYALEVLNQPIEAIQRDVWRDRFDVVTLLDCLEHIPAPRDALEKISFWVKPGGVILIRGPLANSRLARAKEGIRRLTGIEKRLPGYPLDANTFNVRSMTALLRGTGFGKPELINATEDFANVRARKLAR